jgi:hypothetical protein
VRDSRPIETEYEDYMAAMDRLDRDAAARRLTAVCILVTRPDTPPPPAEWRSRYSQAAAAAVAPQFLGVVTTSRVQRGALTAMRWLSGKSGVAEAFATFEEASAGARAARHGDELEELPALLAEAESALTSV